MTELQEAATSFDGLAASGQSAGVYSGLKEVKDATKEGEYEENTKGLKKPWTLPVYNPPVVRLVF